MSEDPTGLLIYAAIALAIACGIVTCNVNAVLDRRHKQEAELIELRREVKTPCR